MELLGLKTKIETIINNLENLDEKESIIQDKINQSYVKNGINQINTKNDLDKIKINEKIGFYKNHQTIIDGLIVGLIVGIILLLIGLIIK